MHALRQLVIWLNGLDTVYLNILLDLEKENKYQKYYDKQNKMVG